MVMSLTIFFLYLHMISLLIVHEDEVGPGLSLADRRLLVTQFYFMCSFLSFHLLPSPNCASIGLFFLTFHSRRSLKTVQSIAKEKRTRIVKALHFDFH